MLDLMGPTRGLAHPEHAKWKDDGRGVPSLPLETFGVTDTGDLAWSRSPIGRQRLITCEQSMLRASHVAQALAWTFTHCSALAGFTVYADQEHTRPGWDVRELAAGHNAPPTAPHALTARLPDAA